MIELFFLKKFSKLLFPPYFRGTSFPQFAIRLRRLFFPQGSVKGGRHPPCGEKFFPDPSFWRRPGHRHFQYLLDFWWIGKAKTSCFGLERGLNVFSVSSPPPSFWAKTDFFFRKEETLPPKKKDSMCLGRNTQHFFLSRRTPPPLYFFGN